MLVDFSEGLQFSSFIYYLVFYSFSLRNTLSFNAKEVRAGALRILRYVLTSREVFEIMLKLRIDLLVARSVDTLIVRDIERLQAFRFIRQVCIV